MYVCMHAYMYVLRMYAYMYYVCMYVYVRMYYVLCMYVHVRVCVSYVDTHAGLSSYGAEINFCLEHCFVENEVIP
jgi:hypothetical protein